MLFRYIVFSFIATGINLTVASFGNRLLLHIIPIAPIFLTISQGLWVKLLGFIAKCAGIGSGFFLKYFLDKKYVFDDSIGTKKEETKKASLYALMSLITTIQLFVVSGIIEFLIDWKYEFELGWLIGLVSGYVAKYYLDKKFVFKQS